MKHAKSTKRKKQTAMNTRFESRAQREEIRKAAKLAGQSLNTYLVRSAHKAARNDLQLSLFNAPAEKLA